MKNWSILCSILLGCSIAVAQKEDPYADSPSSYRPGHPLAPAESAAIITIPGFKVEKVLTVPEVAGSITAMTTDKEGNLIVAMQHQPGLYRVRPTELGSENESRLEALGGVAASVGWCQGLLYAFDSLYVTVAEKNGLRSSGLYQLSDMDKDGEFDEVTSLLELDGAGEHGPHSLAVGPDEESLYFICGNGTPVPDVIKNRRTIITEGNDHLMPEGFESTQYTEGGWIVRMRPDGSDAEIFAAGLRNSYDLAFNKEGDLLTFDSDMEYDLGTPWYRPTRICHLVSGSEFGWRSGAGKWPEYFEDSVKPVVNIGPASPTGVIFGYDTQFPGKYQDAFYALDWTFATLYAVHLNPNGASYSGEVEVFASGIGLPLTDVAIGQDGAMYLSVGGRRLGSAIYRIYFDGPEGVYGKVPDLDNNQDSCDLRLSVESLHGQARDGAVDKVWGHLGSEDRSIRYAARVALETQPVEEWKSQVLAEGSLQIQLPALLALARKGSKADLLDALDQLDELPLEGLSEGGWLLALRVYELVLARGGNSLRELASDHSFRLSRHMPHASNDVNRELSRILCYLGESAAIDQVLDLMDADSGEKEILGADLVHRNLRYGTRVMDMMQAAPMVDRMYHAAMLTWIKDDWSQSQRERYFQSIVDAMLLSKGGKGYQVYWEQILSVAKEALSPGEVKELSSIWAPIDMVVPLPAPEGPGKIWEMDYLLERIAEGFGKRDFENGKKMYSAANCITCHVMMSEGGIVGPSLTSVGQRFTVKDVLDAIIHPSNVISDQYQLTTVTLESGDVLSGRIHSRDASQIMLASNALNPTQIESIPNSDIESIVLLAVSSMPPGLLAPLNEEEVLDLIAYIMAGGHYEHPVYSEN
ncbi:MAG: c-type cytochrome [Opitutales bacterium]|nr:c-type cytochrome [Opitutales bacterium]